MCSEPMPWPAAVSGTHSSGFPVARSPGHQGFSRFQPQAESQGVVLGQH